MIVTTFIILAKTFCQFYQGKMNYLERLFSLLCNDWLFQCIRQIVDGFDCQIHFLVESVFASVVKSRM